MRTRWIVSIVAFLALAVGALGWAGTRPVDSRDDPADPNDGPRWMADRHPGPDGMGFGMGRRMGMMGQRMGMMRRRGELMKELDLSKQQRRQIMDIQDRQQRKAVGKRAEVQVAALDLRKLMRADRPDRVAIEHQIDVIARLRADLRKSQVETLFDICEVLTPEQREKARDRWMGDDEG